jgi:hypothetical protein
MKQLHAALARTAPENAGQLAAGSQAEQDALARFSDFVSQMSVQRTPAMVRQVYASEVYFDDTLKEVHGSEALAAYFKHSLGGAESVTVEILDVAQSGGDYYVRWQMAIRFRSLADGRLTESTGVSQLRFDPQGLITFHKDYWDSTNGFFQYVPVVGRMIGWVKGRL